MERPNNAIFYGGGGTIHTTNHLNVETRNGKVVSVWFRCCALPFDQTVVTNDRAREMEGMYAQGNLKALIGVELEEPFRWATVFSEHWRCKRCQQVFSCPTTQHPPARCLCPCNNPMSSPDWEPLKVVKVVHADEEKV